MDLLPSPFSHQTNQQTQRSFKIRIVVERPQQVIVSTDRTFREKSGQKPEISGPLVETAKVSRIPRRKPAWGCMRLRNSATVELKYSKFVLHLKSTISSDMMRHTCTIVGLSFFSCVVGGGARHLSRSIEPHRPTTTNSSFCSRQTGSLTCGQ